jgi:hypothetical protein
VAGMKVTLESTSQVVLLNDKIPARVWEGETASGIKVQAVIARVAAEDDQDLSQFVAELVECRPPSDAALEAFPLRMII